MATRTSSQSGNWNDTATWGGAAAPGDGDTAVIGHTVTATEDFTVGTSPSDRTTFVIAVNSGGKLILNPGVDATVKGNVSAGCGASGAAANWLEMGAGSTFIMDSSGAVTPTTVYTVYYASRYCNLYARGTSGSLCVFGGSSGGGTVDISYAVADTGSGVDAEYTTFQYMGASASNGPRFTPTVAGVLLRLYHCTFSNCGRIYLSPRYQTITALVDGCTIDSISASLAFQAVGRTPLDTAFTLQNNVFLCQAIFTPATNIAIHNNYFSKGTSTASMSTTGYSGFRACSGNFFNIVTSSLDSEGFKDSYAFFNSASGNSAINVIHAKYQDTEVSGNVLEALTNADGVVGDWLQPKVATNGLKVKFLNNIFLPKQNGGSPGKFVSVLARSADAAAGYIKAQIDHNTYCTDAQDETGVGIGEVVSGDSDVNVAGMVTSLKSNIAFGPAGYKLVHQHSTVQNIAAYDACDYNCGYQITAGAEGKGYTKWGSNPTDIMTGGSPGAHDIDENPAFWDSARNVVLYDSKKLGNSATAWASGANYVVGDFVSVAIAGIYGGLTANLRCIANHTSASGNANTGQPLAAATTGWRTYWEPATLYRLRGDVTKIADLISWVKRGYRPTNANLDGAGHDSADIGAVSYFAGISLSSPANGMQGTPYSATLSPSGGAAPYGTFAVASGALPTGLSLSAAGAITGTPTASGTAIFTVSFTDADGESYTSGSLSLEVAAGSSGGHIFNTWAKGDFAKTDFALTTFSLVS